MNRIREQIRESVVSARRKTLEMIGQIENKPVTPGQRKLAQMHGSPMEFARGCVEAIGEISYHECLAAVEKYVKEWNAA